MPRKVVYSLDGDVIVSGVGLQDTAKLDDRTVKLVDQSLNRPEIAD